MSPKRIIFKIDFKWKKNNKQQKTNLNDFKLLNYLGT